MSTGMTIVDMLGQSGLLTLLGMGVVFAFIILLIICMKLLHVFVNVANRNKKEEKANVPVKSVQSNSVQTTDEDVIIAAIAAAVHDKQLNS